MLSLSPENLNPICGYVKLSYQPYPLNLGYPGFSPFLTRRKESLESQFDAFLNFL